MTVTDSDGFYGTALGTFTVNGTPTAPGISLTPSSPNTADDLRVTIDAASVDPEGAALTYAYAWSVDGVPSAASVSAALPASATTRGEVWSVDVTATDGLATSVAGTASVTITNTAPTLVTLSLTPDPAWEGDILTCNAGFTADADGDAVGLTYDWTVSGSPLGYNSDTLEDSFFDRGDSVYCTATPTDGTDDGATVLSNTVTIQSSPPVVDTVAVSPSTGAVGATLTCSASATDGDSVTLTYAWSTGATGDTLTLTASDDPGDILTCTATATDTDGGTDTASAIATVSNTAPALDTVTISPSNAYNDDLLTCSASATDADGGSPTLTYAWTNTSTGASLGSGVSVLLSSATAASLDTIACAATATDADSGTATSSTSLTLDNRAPVATASLSPSSTTSTSTLTCTGSATDGDDDSTTLTFSWTVDGSPVSASTTSALSSTLVGAFVANHLVACTVTASDTKTGTDTDTASVTIGGTAPVVSSVTLSPGTVYTNDTLTANVVASDADGDTLSFSYDWYVDGVVVLRGASGSLSGLSYFDRDEVVYVVVTANDGAQTGSGTSSSVTVLNTAPGAPGVEITPTGPTSGDTLTCTVTTPATDPDGDALTYTFVWDVDGVDYPSATDSAMTSVVDGADVGGEETWTCEVVADDGTLTGASASASVTTACASGSSPDCASSSCYEIMMDGHAAGDGIYYVDPGGSGAVAVYCDMTTDGGGWTLLARGGAACASRSLSYSLMSSVTAMLDTATCSYMAVGQVNALATAGATEVMLRVGASWGSWSNTELSTNSLALTALQTSTGTWHNGATWTNNFSWAAPISGCPVGSIYNGAVGWPNMYHACGVSSGVHWIQGDGLDTGSPPSHAVSTTWLR